MSPSSDWLPSSISVPNPGAGLEATFAVPGSERQLLVGAAFVLTAAAGGANRTPVLEVLDGSGVLLCGCAAGFALTAGSAATYSFVHGLAEWDAANNLFASGPCPLLPLDVGALIRVHVENLAAGDTLTAIRFTVLQEPVRPSSAG